MKKKSRKLTLIGMVEEEIVYDCEDSQIVFASNRVSLYRIVNTKGKHVINVNIPCIGHSYGLGEYESEEEAKEEFLKYDSALKKGRKVKIIDGTSAEILY